jgi:isoquinoline 1-oxidoreductase beta subunit
MTVHADRRQFMTWSAGGAFMLALSGEASAQPAAAPAAGGVSPWFKVNANGRVTVYSKAVEMGQGSHTGHASILADELDVPFDMVDVEMADINTYSDTIFTGGSRSIQSTFKQASEAGATARSQFIQAAAKQWGVDPTQCETAGGKVVYKASKASLTYGQLAATAGQMPAPAQITLKPASSRACIGKDMPTQRGKLRATGKEIYGIDVRVPGMLRASIIQAPYGAKLVAVDEGPAMAVPGVVKVVKLDNAVAVVGKDTWTAFKGVRALKPQWTTPELRANSKDYVPALAAANKAALAQPATGDAAALRAAYDAAPKKVEGSYTLTRVHHVTMEPQNTTAHVRGDTIEIWSPTQVPSSIKRGAAAWAGKPNAKVILHTTMLGGGYGRRLNTDFAEQAVRIAAQVDAPVQLVWTREEDFAHDVYRTAVHQTYRAGLKADGTIDGYETVSVAADTAIRGGMAPAPYAKITKHAITQAAGTTGVKTGVPFGAWRSVDEGISTWGRESFIDECAIAAGKDPVAYRISLLGDDLAGERGKRLLKAVSDAIGWNKPKAPGVGRGVALGVGFNSMAAHAVEVEIKGDTLKVTKIVAAGDLGTVVAPNQVKAQFQGGTLMALGTALNEGMTFTNGEADQRNFSAAYQPLRIHQAPQVEVILFDHPKAPVGGSGEPPVPTLAPALANAIANASGKRIRSLPIKNEGFKV